MRTDKTFLLVKVTIRTNYPNTHDAIPELQQGTDYHIGSTENVEVLEAEIIELKTKG